MGLDEVFEAGVMDLSACGDAAVDPEHNIFQHNIVPLDEVLSDLGTIMPITMLNLSRVIGDDVRTLVGSDAESQEIVERTRVSSKG